MPESAPAEWPLRVRYAETDQMRVAHHANYFIWFEAARSEFCRVNALNYSALEAAGYSMPVVEARCRYMKPARYDDELVVRVIVAEVTSRIVKFEYSVHRGTETLAVGETRQVLLDHAGLTVRFPAELRALFAAIKPVGGEQDAAD
ncbi:MAG: acyl-CoA thioesterase [Armatimonadetes bacterium]|nr:acyl-CoA thioesterase [Armatimonadota bacterium]MDE2205401.1 acyl-CoA thioesterase [Armatimonadota bacterium]